MSFSILDYIMPHPVVEVAKKAVEDQIAREKVNQAVEESLQKFIQAGTIMAGAMVPGAGVGLGLSAGKIFQSAGEAWGQISQDYSDFYRMIKETNGEVLLDYFKFLVGGEFGRMIFDGTWEGLKRGLDLSSGAPLQLMNEISPERTLECMFTFATFSLNPLDCDRPMPFVDVSRDDVEEVLEGAADVAEGVVTAVFPGASLFL